MKVLQAINKLDLRDELFFEPVFVAGGISGCPNWQAEFLSKFGDEDEFIFLNPRRDDFDITNPNESVKQIQWECEYLEEATTVIFWFPEETLCPITLFELGKIVAGECHNVHVGCHPNYKRRLDVITQLAWMAPDIKVVDSLDDLAAQLKGTH